MDHSQHSIHNHEHHLSMTTPDDMNLDHVQMLTTTTNPLDVMSSGDHNMHGMHQNHQYKVDDPSGGMDHSAGHDTMSTTMNHMMSMSFHFGCNETVLFSWWQFDSVGGLIGSMIAIFIIAVLYEGLKYYREYLFWKTYNLLEYRPVTGPQRTPEDPQQRTPAPTGNTPSPVQYVGEVIHKQPPTMCSLHHLYQTLLHIVQVTVSFLLMLIFMTYNVWLCMAVVLGAATGYFLFCWKKSVIVDVTEHCH